MLYVHYQRATLSTKLFVVFQGKRFRNFAPRQRRQKDVVPESVLRLKVQCQGIRKEVKDVNSDKISLVLESKGDFYVPYA